MAKVLFQSINSRLFRATLVGYLYEISQKDKVILMAEGIDSYTKKILGDKNLFPGLEKIIFFEPPFQGDIFRKNYRLCQKSKRIVRDYKPDIVITPDDIWPMGLYLLRFAKKAGAITLAIQDGFRVAEGKKLFLWSCLTNAHLKMPRSLPFFLRLFLVKMKKYLGHLFYYWVLPITAGELPFLGKTSFVFWDTSVGMRDADYSVVFSEREYNLSIRDGVPAEKLFILSHPLKIEVAKNFFEKVYFSDSLKKQKTNSKILTVIFPEEQIGLKRDDYSVISKEKIQESRIKIITLITEILKGWRIFIKPHPMVKNTLEIKKTFESISNYVKIVEPLEPVDKYIEMSDIILGSSQASTALFTASLQCPNKIILSLDLDKEFLGDSYKDFEGIEYIDSEKEFIETLNRINNNEYRKKPATKQSSSFNSINELLDYIYPVRNF